jgi:hypothetical protein
MTKKRLALSVLVVGLILGYAVYHRVQSRGVANPMGPDLEVGGRLCLPGQVGVRTSGPRTVFLVVNSTCSFCKANRQFEEKLYARCAALRIPLIYLLPDRQDQDAAAKQLKLLGRMVVRANLSVVGVRRVPSTLAVDQNGTVLAMRTGLVVPRGAEQVVEHITAGTGKLEYARVRGADVETECRRSGAYQILAFRAPSKPLFPGAHYTVIPPSELGVRAKYELRTQGAVFVDCSAAGVTPFMCQEALLTLSQMGFGRLFAVDLARRQSPGCRGR